MLKIKKYRADFMYFVSSVFIVTVFGNEFVFSVAGILNVVHVYSQIPSGISCSADCRSNRVGQCRPSGPCFS